MNQIETQYAIGDLVYTANEHGYDRDVIKAIKIESLNQKISYGFGRKSDGFYGFMFGYSDKYNWYGVGTIFESKEKAQAHHEALKAKEDAKAAKEREQRKKERLAKLDKERQSILDGEDDDDYEI